MARGPLLSIVVDLYTNERLMVPLKLLQEFHYCVAQAFHYHSHPLFRNPWLYYYLW